MIEIWSYSCSPCTTRRADYGLFRQLSSIAKWEDAATYSELKLCPAGPATALIAIGSSWPR
jgi:hypothetical protein